MAVSGLLSQTWTLTKKDLLLVGRRRWFSTFIRALAFPIVLTVILASVKNWIHNGGGYGIGTPSPIRSLPEAFDMVGNTRSKFVIVDRNLPGNDVRYVIDQLRTLAQNGRRDVRILQDQSQIQNECPSSSKGLTDCFGAIDFWSSPDQGPGAIWNYTIWQDSVIGGTDVRRDDNSVQVYTMPLQRAVESLISARNNGTQLPSTVLQYPFTLKTQAQKDFEDEKFYGLLVTQVIAFALFLALCGIAYHLTGYVVRQREEGVLHLIDAQMPNKSRWESLFARMFATHLAFDMVYLPGWIICGALTGTIIYPHTNAGWFVLMYILAGLAMTSFSILASSLFRRQQLSAISAIVAAIAFAIVAQFSQSGQKSTTTAAATATGLLFPPSSFVYFLVSSAVSEIFGQPVRLNQEINALVESALGIKVWKLTPSTFLGFFVFQIILYPILALFIERFLWGSSFQGRHLRSPDEMQGNAVRISNFTKRYNKAVKKSDRTLAVDGLSLDVYAGQIMVLLGANGSGKSTTMSCITGLESITKGTIDIDGSGGIGLCPQKNVMWPDMTVEEHVWFFQQLKNPSLSREEGRKEVKRLIDSCDLGKKTHAKSKTLSGGQQRKLQLCMMLAGGSRVCCIDEASSGIDPLARRKIWDILLRERGHRTMLLTTHFLDESEVLADHIALLSKGKLRAQGTVASLKNTHGEGFRVTLANHNAPINRLEIGPEIQTQRLGNDAVFDAPDSATLTNLLSELDKHGFTEYGIEGPSIEKIFLRLADEMRPAQLEMLSVPVKGSIDPDFSTEPDAAMELHTGRGCGPLRQTGVLFHKRLTILKHNFMPYVAALFVPLVVAGLVTRFLLSVDNYGLQCRDPNKSYDSHTITLAINTYDFNHMELVLGPRAEVTTEIVDQLIPDGHFGDYDDTPLTNTDWSSAIYANTADDFSADIKTQANPSYYGMAAGGFFIQRTAPSVFAWPAEEGLAASIALLATVDMVQTNTSVAVSYRTFVAGYTPKDYFQSLVAVFTTLGFALFPGLFALYPTRERLQKVRAMHYSNGISSGPLWTAYALFDFCWLLLIAILTIAIWAAAGYNWYGLGYLFVVFLFYGLAATAYSYIISLFAPSQLAAIAMTCIVQVVIAMLFFVGCFLTVDNANLTVLYRQLDIIYYTIALICPGVSLLRALLVCLNVYALACNGTLLAPNPGDISLYGAPILYLVLQSFIFVAFLIFWESGRSFEAFGIRLGKRRQKMKDFEKLSDSGSDGTEDSYRLSESNNGLRVLHLSKTFGSNHAVDDVSFGILPSEKFALLGPNGAGKSTTISLIRGDLRPDSTSYDAEIHITGDSLMHTPVAAKQHLGVCPQFDAVDSMTLSEHLHFYARARGLTGKQKDENIREIITRLGLQDHTKKLVKKLSGGTKRKLSLGIALVGNPSVLLLDEPSSGMDAAAKRKLWGTLQAISTGRSLLLTTHSMEEADAICDRAGILASQMLALGTISSLHERFGDKIYVHLVHANAPRSSTDEMDVLWQWVGSTFLLAETEKSVGGQIRFAVPLQRPDNAPANLLDGRNMARLFRAIEASKDQMDIRDYSISHATLDQVFLNVVARHGVDEENSGAVQQSRLSRIFKWKS